MSEKPNRNFTIGFGTLSLDIIVEDEHGKHLHSSFSGPSGWDIVEATLDYLKSDRHLLVNRLSAVVMLRAIGSAVPPVDVVSHKIMGRSLITGTPHIEYISSMDLHELLLPVITMSLETIISRMETEISMFDDDAIANNTIKLSGEFRNFLGLADLIEHVIRSVLLPDATVVIQPC